MTCDAGKVPKGDPLAYFLTWTTYGTWLPGDDRGWVAKPGGFRPPDESLEQAVRTRMTELHLILDDQQRQTVERTIEDHCRIRGWHLHAVSCRTNHVHVVVTAHDRHPEEIMDQLKAWCTRTLKAEDRSRSLAGSMGRSKWWTQRGSKRWLNDQASLEAAICYVQECQNSRPPQA
jgi:REP element-mobilizing transposase RayT